MHQQILSPDLVISFYSGTQFRPAWHHGINLHASAFQFIKLLEQAHLNALNSENYHLSALRELLKEFHHSQTLARNPNFLVALDLLLTDAALHYADHLNSGTINPKTLVKPWEVEKEPLNLIAFSKSLSDNTLGNFYDTLQPNHPAYKRLHRLMLLHLSLQQSYVLPFKDFQKTLIKAGNAHDCIPLIRQCFSLLDNANFDTTSNKLYDKVLENRIKRFQKAHKTTPNGNISSNTLGHLTEAMQQRFEKLLINLERWRWLPNNFGNEYERVNITT